MIEKKEKKKKKKPLTIEEIQKAMDVSVENLNDKFTKSLDSLEKKVFKNFSKIENVLITVNQKTLLTLKQLDRDRKKFTQRAEKLEETFLYILHNVKKNQFLYAHYPEDWVNDYLDIKKGLKSENEFMDKKIGAK